MTTVEVTEQIVAVVDASVSEIALQTVETVQVVEVGIAGPQGPQGASGAASASYVHVQAVPATTWTVVHNLGMYPNVTVVDTLGRVVMGDEAYIDLNTVVLTFSAAFSGQAFAS